MNYKFNPNMYELVAKNVKKFRNEKKLSLESLANKTDIDLSFLKKFEQANNNMAISIYDLYKISVVLDIRIDLFFLK